MIAAGTSATSCKVRADTHIRAYDVAHSTELWHQPRLGNVTAPEAGKFLGLLLL